MVRQRGAADQQSKVRTKHGLRPGWRPRESSPGQPLPAPAGRTVVHARRHSIVLAALGGAAEAGRRRLLLGAGAAGAAAAAAAAAQQQPAQPAQAAQRAAPAAAGGRQSSAHTAGGQSAARHLPNAAAKLYQPTQLAKHTPDTLRQVGGVGLAGQRRLAQVQHRGHAQAVQLGGADHLGRGWGGGGVAGQAACRSPGAGGRSSAAGRLTMSVRRPCHGTVHPTLR